MMMVSYDATREISRPPTHPGEIFRDDVLNALNLPVQTAAKQLGITRQTLHRILSGTHSVSPTMALRFGKFCGNGPELWINMQIAYDLFYATRELGTRLDSIPTHKAA
jgi:antitoxin HigA-1